MAKEKININDKEKFLFWYGILFGILGGIIGNVIVSSCFTLITKSYKDDIGLVSTLIVLGFSLIIFFWLINNIMKKLK